jgi:hypothetical protein
MRFPLRSMLLVTTGLALLAATIGPLYRGAHPEARLYVFAFWIGILAILILFGLLEWRQSIRRKRLVGQLRFQLRRINRPCRSIIGIFFAWGMLLYSVFGAYGMTHSVGMFHLANGPSAGQLLAVCISGVFIGALIVAAIDFVTRPWTYSGRIELGESGVMIDRRAVPWSDFRYVEWHDDYPNRLVLLQKEWTYLTAVPSALQDEVEALIRSKTTFDLKKKTAPGH